MLTQEQREALASGAGSWNVTLDEATLDRFSRFAELLEEGNRRLNLTRIASEDIVTLHFLDSLAVTTVYTPKPSMQVLDVGTGAGFPGIPLALVFPETRFCLLDGTRKRLHFLDEVIAALKLSNVCTLHGRAEEIARQPDSGARFDLVLARAVAKMPVLAGWLLPLTRPGGVAVAYKSRDIENEVAEAGAVIRRSGGGVEQIAEVALPGTDIVRKLVVIRKQKPANGAKTDLLAQRRRR